MKPLTLTVQAFGPYVQRQTLDFADLRGRALFLIHGPTGAGKTTLLDAMCYALYGETSGAERKGEEMRSDHAAPALPTEVIFDFALGGETYRILRRPAKAPRREGASRGAGEAALSRRTGLAEGDGEVLATGVTAVTAQVEALLGLDVDQFRQVVILPQGKFREFLCAKSQDRQEILEKLFQTALYRNLELALKNKAHEVEAQAADARKEQRTLLSTVEAEEPAEVETRAAALEEALTQRIEALQALRQAEQASRGQYDVGRKVAELLQQRDDAQQALAALAARAEAIGGQRAELEAARRAALLVPEERALEERRREARDAEAALARARAAQQQAAAERDRAKRALDAELAREMERQAAQAELTRLGGIAATMADLEAARAQRKSATADAEARARAAEGTRLTLAQTRTRLAQAQQARQEAETLAAQVEGRQLAVADAERRVDRRLRLAQSADRQVQAHRQHTTALQQLDAAEQTVAFARALADAAQEHWLAGQAALLAQGLQPGAPCPVCGAREHPVPARAAGELPDEATVKSRRHELAQAQQRLDEARAAESERRTALAAAETQAAHLAAELGDDAAADPARLAARLQEARQALAEAQAARAQGAVLAEQLDILARQEAALAARLTTEEAALASARDAQTGAQSVVADRERGIPPELRAPAALPAATRAAQARATALQRALEAARADDQAAQVALARAESAVTAADDAATAARRSVAAGDAQLAAHLQERGFADLDAFRAAVRPEAALGQLDSALRDYDAAVSAAKDRLIRAQQAAAGVTAPDLPALEAAAAAAKGALEEALREDERLRKDLARLRGVLGQVRQVAERITALEAHFQVIGHLAQVASGDNPRRVSFARFVLGALLDHVLRNASQRLEKMSRGRFTLHRAAAGDRRRQLGLDLVVEDTYTGVRRPVATLSGGESFQAALSLALSLADVVQRYAGGIRLDTVFVDEGFGSLDPDALDLALSALADLSGGNRLVGIISHVPELTGRIDARLEVTADRTGSSARFVVV